MRNRCHDRRRAVRAFSRAAVAGLVSATWLGLAEPAVADTLEQALTSAYQHNPHLVALCVLSRGVASAPQAALDNDMTRLADTSAAMAREALRGTEQTILLNAAAAYLDSRRDAAIVDLQRRNIELIDTLLLETLRLARQRGDNGAATPADVARAEAQLASARTALANAETQYDRSRITYREVIGAAADKLVPAAPVDRLIPRRQPDAIELGRTRHPEARGAVLGVEASFLETEILKGAPYRGVVAEALLHSATDTLMQRLKDRDATRDRVQANVITAWDQLEATRSRVLAATNSVAANEIALTQQREKARAADRPALDVLNAQRDLVDARVALATVQHDRVLVSFVLLAAIGELNLAKLGIDCRATSR